MARIIEFDTVRVIALHGTPESHLAIANAERPPRVGDVGTVVDVAAGQTSAERRYVVESGRSGGRAVWLAEFGADELEFVARPGAPPR